VGDADMSRCTGCSAKAAACQAENNIPVVGKYQSAAVARCSDPLTATTGPGGVTGDGEPADTCQHRDRAVRVRLPGERHRPLDEGLNDMVYNRCIGTRYCSNNCPQGPTLQLPPLTQDSQVEKMLMNPDVTVRARGVMEKCTYCAAHRADAHRRPHREPDHR
jgi:molybdopterin-containing oxidoreductase family iron-sulfur binding subunit